jgi:hypothetical protein
MQSGSRSWRSKSCRFGLHERGQPFVMPLHMGFRCCVLLTFLGSKGGGGRYHLQSMASCDPTPPGQANPCLCCLTTLALNNASGQIGH